MLFDDLKAWNIILASSSPRRKELLENLGLNFKQVNYTFNESFPENLDSEAAALFLAEQKADCVQDKIKNNEIVITADTIVSYGDNILGKPSGRDEAIDMLFKLSGKKHNVSTGVCISTATKRKCFTSSTEVVFADLDRDEIEYYTDNYKPYDKAGAYGIQEWIGYIGVKEITGSYFNVMGLPVQRLYKELKCFARELKI
jgi:septum formation protein